MFAHLVLGVLRDGEPRHGYDVTTELRVRIGARTNPGNVYRELAKLTSLGLIEATRRAPEADARRNPYRINAEGCRVFDVWLRSPTTQDEELSAWVAFVDRVPDEELPAVLDRLEERLWLRTKHLALAREEAASRNDGILSNPIHANGAVVRCLLQLKCATAALDFVEELRRARVVTRHVKSNGPTRRSRVTQEEAQK